MRRPSSPSSGSTLSGSSQQLPERLRKKIRGWKRLPKEKKLDYLRGVMEKIRELAEKDKIRAWVTFNLWLSSEDGAIAYPWMWKPAFRRVMVEIAYYYLKIIDKLLKSQAKNTQKKIK